MAANRLRVGVPRYARAMPKTQKSDESVADFMASISDERRRADTAAAVDLMRAVTGAEPAMWGSSIIGFGDRPYTTADGRSHDWFVIGVAPRKAALTLYGLTFYGSNADLLDRLGTHTTGKGCLYLKRFDDADRGVLTELVERGWNA